MGYVGPLFGDLVRKVVPPVYYDYPWTLHGSIGWDRWQELFVDFCLEDKTALSTVKELAEPAKALENGGWGWLPLLILFFVERNSLNHYGSYEAQILLHVHITSSPERGYERLQWLAKVVGMDQHLPVLRHLYVGYVQTIVAGSHGYQLRYHHLLNEATQEMQRVAQSRF